MAGPQEKLATSLAVLAALQARGVVAVRSSELSRTHHERLPKNRYLRKVMNGWYSTSRRTQMNAREKLRANLPSPD